MMAVSDSAQRMPEAIAYIPLSKSTDRKPHLQQQHPVEQTRHRQGFYAPPCCAYPHFGLGRKKQVTHMTAQHYSINRHPPLVLTSSTLDMLNHTMRTCLLDTMGALLGHGSCQAVEEGMGGTYFVKDKHGTSLGIFKPVDEEPMAPNNPKALQGRFGELTIKKGLRSGEGAIREVAAYDLDRASGGLAGVPPTVMCRLSTSGRAADLRLGSYQLFVLSDGAASDFSPTTMDISQLQAVAALDMRLLNVDRHDGNLLVRSTPGNQYKNDNESHRAVIPIDHGCIAPSTLEVGWCEWCWLDWPAIAQPILPIVRRHILNLDPVATAMDLVRLGVRPECAWNCALSTAMLRAVVSSRPDMTLRDVALLMCRNNLDQPSVFEQLAARVASRLPRFDVGKRKTEKMNKSVQHGIKLSQQRRELGFGEHVETDVRWTGADKVIKTFEDAVVRHLNPGSSRESRNDSER